MINFSKRTHRHLVYARRATGASLLLCSVLLGGAPLASALMNPLYAQQQQSSTVTGRITDAQGQPQADATIRVLETGFVGSTDSNGRFNLRLPAGNYTLVVKHLSFEELKQAITVRAGENLTLNLKVEGKSSALEEVVVTALGITRAAKSVGYS